MILLEWWGALYVVLAAYIALKLYQTRRKHREAPPLAPVIPLQRRAHPPNGAGGGAGARRPSSTPRDAA